MIAAAIAAGAALLVGLACGVFLSLRFFKWRQADWVGLRCHQAARKLSGFFGNSNVIAVMHARASGGHRFDKDKGWRRSIEDVLREGLGLERRPL